MSVSAFAAGTYAMQRVLVPEETVVGLSSISSCRVEEETIDSLSPTTVSRHPAATCSTAPAVSPSGRERGDDIRVSSPLEVKSSGGCDGLELATAVYVDTVSYYGLVYPRGTYQVTLLGLILRRRDLLGIVVVGL